MSRIKYCKDCKFFIPPDHSKNLAAECSSPQAVYIDYVEGNNRTQLCHGLRNLAGRCGPEGKLFIPANIENLDG